MTVPETLAAVALGSGALGSVVLARRVSVPYPVFVVLFGVAASFLPGANQLTIPPDAVYFGLLPPLIYFAGFVASPRAILANAGTIGWLALGLVIATMFSVALIAHTTLAGALPWSVALVLGAVVAPTDPVAALTVLESAGAPRRVQVVLEGESLLNDGIAFTLFTVAVAGATGGSVSLPGGVLKFLVAVTGAVAVGIAVGWVVEWLRRRTTDVDVEIALSVLTPYLVFVPAEEAGFSGVLATVVTGLYLGLRAEGTFRPRVRQRARSFWDVVDFGLNAVLFVILGLEFRSVLEGVKEYSAFDLAVGAFAVCAVGIGLRVAWQFTVEPALRTVRVPRWLPRNEPMPWQHRLLIGWGGLRGATSLAAALSVPLTMDDGSPLPGRGPLLFFAFIFIYVTLVLQGASLGPLVRLLRQSGEGEGSAAELKARREMAMAALRRIDELARENEGAEEMLAPLRQDYTRRRQHAEQLLDPEQDREPLTQLQETYREAVTEVIRAEHACLDVLVRRRAVSAPIARRLLNELDLEQLRYE